MFFNDACFFDVRSVTQFLQCTFRGARVRLLRLRSWLLNRCAHTGRSRRCLEACVREPGPLAANEQRNFAGVGIGQHQESIMLRYDVRLTPKPKGLDSGVSL
jgi:hypothetical protein